MARTFSPGRNPARLSCTAATRAVSLALFTTLSTAASCQNMSGRTVEASFGMRPEPKLLDYVGIDRTIPFPDSPASSAVEVSFDQGPGFLVVIADASRAQLRQYDENAHLMWAAGRNGPGPSEFQRLRSAVRNSAGEVIALDNSGRVSLWDRNGNWIRTWTTELSPTYTSILLDDSTLLISGRLNGGSTSPLLHLFDLKTGHVRKSFFNTPPHPAKFDDAYMFSGWANATKLNDNTLGVIFALSDSLYLFNTDGVALGQHPLNLRRFLPLQEPSPRDDSPAAEIAWRSSYSRLTHIFRAPDNSIYIQYGGFHDRRRIWSLARYELTPQGNLEQKFEVPDTIRLLAISPRGGDLYFLDPDSLEMISWSVGHLLQR